MDKKEIDGWALRSETLNHYVVKRVFDYIMYNRSIKRMRLETIAGYLNIWPSLVALSFRELESHGWIKISRESVPYQYEIIEQALKD